MRFYKIVEDGYIMFIGTGPGGEEISQAEYDHIMSVFKTYPDHSRFFKLNEKSFLWEEFPMLDNDDKEAT